MGTPALVKSSNFTIELETTYGTDPNPTDTNLDDALIELSGTPNFTDSYDTVERDIVRQAFSTYAPIRGTQNTSGDFKVEAHGSGAYNSAPESGIAYKAAFGYCIGSATQTGFVDHVLSTTVTNSIGASVTNSSIFIDPQMYEHNVEVTSATNFEVGYPVRIMDSTGATLRLAGFIKSISANTLTILSSKDTISSLTDGDIVDCGHLYTLRDYALNQVAALPSFTAKYFRGNITREVYTGNIVTQFALDASTGQLLQPTFNWEGKTVGYTSASQTWSASHTYDSDVTDPIVCRLTDVFMESADGDAYQKCISNLQINLANEVFKQQCIATEGVGQVIRTKRNVTGSLNTFYEDRAFQTAFTSDTSYILRAMFNYSQTNSTYNDTPGNILAIFAPSLKFSSVGISEDTGIFKYDTQFSLQPTGTGDNEFLLAIL